MTCTPLTSGGDVGGASATTVRVNGLPASAGTTAGVVALSTWAKLWPPSVDLKTPEPVTPAYKIRALAGVDRSSASDHASPSTPLAAVQSSPPFEEVNRSEERRVGKE